MRTIECSRHKVRRSVRAAPTMLALLLVSVTPTCDELCPDHFLTADASVMLQ